MRQTRRVFEILIPGENLGRTQAIFSHVKHLLSEIVWIEIVHINTSENEENVFHILSEAEALRVYSIFRPLKIS